MTFLLVFNKKTIITLTVNFTMQSFEFRNHSKNNKSRRFFHIKYNMVLFKKSKH